MPDRDDCVLQGLLRTRATAAPDRLFALFEDGPQWTYAETLALVKRWASGLAAEGITKGDRVLTWLPNTPEHLLAWFSTCWLGAVHVPINTAYRGNVLSHVITNSGARILITHSSLVERLAGLDLGALTRIFYVGPPPAIDPGIPMSPVTALDAMTSLPPEIDVNAWDTHAIVYTSGTTGPSKGVLGSYVHAYSLGTVSMGYIEAHERILINLPLFHVSGIAGVYAALVKGAGIAIVDGFSPSRFWDQIRQYQCATSCGIVGSMATFLNKLPERPDDRDHPFRLVVMAPLTDAAVSLAERHGFQFYTAFGMTEVPVVMVGEPGVGPTGSCGRPRDGVEARVVDEHDMEVPDGTVGELMLRADLPWAFNHGYHEMPEATAKAWRNGWFHTGDAFRRDADGVYHFVDRMKDAMRRRGENVSSMEVEREVIAHPQVRDAAAVAVPSENGEDDILIVVEPQPGETIDPKALTAFLADRMAYFMVPRYLRFLEELPKTHTARIQKHLLRSEGVTADTWDREAAGIVLRRERRL